MYCIARVKRFFDQSSIINQMHFRHISACFLTAMVCFLNDKNQVFILKVYCSEDYVKYIQSLKIKNHFDQFSIIFEDL